MAEEETTTMLVEADIVPGGGEMLEGATLAVKTKSKAPEEQAHCVPIQLQVNYVRVHFQQAMKLEDAFQMRGAGPQTSKWIKSRENILSLLLGSMKDCSTCLLSAQQQLSLLDFSDFGVKTSKQAKEDEKWDSSHYEALLKGGEQVISALDELVKMVTSIQYIHT
ncbi:hypothetical protein NE237_011561 [Protea cynaroides]|uniref:Uncharacterized protein n=1 Tax=Protea cynaroides TaxID=273540 RepID=A0A9Q0GVW9_9MAGN|nr:hypothetical protein NE237_011561 [Protea cynaroides]